MSAPKSVTKVYGDGRVEYTSDVDAANYYLFELSRAALRDVGKFVSKTFKSKLKSAMDIKLLQKATVNVRVLSSKNTQYPRVEIGLKGGGGSKARWRGWLQEFGTHDGTIPKLGLFTKAVQDNIPTIVEIESKYISALSEEAEALKSMIDENDMEEEDAD